MCKNISRYHGQLIAQPILYPSLSLPYFYLHTEHLPTIVPTKEILEEVSGLLGCALPLLGIACFFENKIIHITSKLSVACRALLLYVGTERVATGFAFHSNTITSVC